ncbi:MAG: hypothetical protein WA192_16810 [Candidatus Acidiferrales bacterium]
MGSNSVTPVLDSRPSDDEILGLLTLPARRPARSVPHDAASRGSAPNINHSASQANETAAANARDGESQGETAAISSAGQSEAAPSGADSALPTVPEHLREALDANPELRDAWQEASAYREAFATPEEARNATALLGDLNRMDALFFSRRPEDHAKLAQAVSQLDPAAFASLARAMAELANNNAPHRDEIFRALGQRNHRAEAARQTPAQPQNQAQDQHQAQDQNRQQQQAEPTPTPAQMNFFHSTNAAAVASVVDAIETQVERLLPEGLSKSARNRVVGEIYRELDATLRGNRALGQQMREAFRSGALDDEHQRAIVSLVTGRARQALPAVAKRVLNEWTTTVVSANHERRARQRSAERRVDIAGSGGAGNDGHRGVSSRDVDYARMSDADILNL